MNLKLFNYLSRIRACEELLRGVDWYDSQGTISKEDFLLVFSKIRLWRLQLEDKETIPTKKKGSKHEECIASCTSLVRDEPVRIQKGRMVLPRRKTGEKQKAQSSKKTRTVG